MIRTCYRAIAVPAAGVEHGEPVQQNDRPRLDKYQTINFSVYTIDEEILGLTYEARYVRPQIGLMPRFLLGDVTLEVRGVVSPLLSVKDIDDHVLRGFQVRTDGKGFGFGGKLALAYRPKGGFGRGWFGRLAVELSRANVNVKGFRKYYRDNPDDGALAGSRFATEHKVSSTQYGVRLQAGFWF